MGVPGLNPNAGAGGRGPGGPGGGWTWRRRWRWGRWCWRSSRRPRRLRTDSDADRMKSSRRARRAAREQAAVDVDDARHRHRRGRRDRDGRDRQRRAAAVKDRINALGTTLLTVNPGQQRQAGVRGRRRQCQADARRRQGARATSGGVSPGRGPAGDRWQPAGHLDQQERQHVDRRHDGELPRSSKVRADDRTHVHERRRRRRVPAWPSSGRPWRRTWASRLRKRYSARRFGSRGLMFDVVGIRRRRGRPRSSAIPTIRF